MRPPEPFVDSRIDVSVIIVSYNTRELTLDCLRSVFEQTRDATIEVFVVDNASADGSADVIAAEFPQVRLFALDQNLGFAAANNFAARHAQGEWLLLLNPDTVVLDRAIDRLVAFARRSAAEDPACGIFGGRTVFADGRLNPTSAWARPTLWSAWCMATGLTSLFRGHRLLNPEAMPHWQRDTERQVDIVTGCFLLLRRSLWQQLGGFDPAFFMYGEEADLCLRARKRGVKCLICPDATIIHYGGASEPVRAQKKVRLLRAKAQLFHRHWSRPAARLGVLLLDLWACSRMLSFWAASRLRPRLRANHESWRSVWRQRAAWHLSAADRRPTPTVAEPVESVIRASREGCGHCADG